MAVDKLNKQWRAVILQGIFRTPDDGLDGMSAFAAERPAGEPGQARAARHVRAVLAAVRVR